MTFSTNDRLKALAIVGAFETGSAFGKFSAVAVLDDGAGISYGFSQFSHRSGALAAVLERYAAIGGAVGRQVIDDRMPLVRRRTAQAINKLASDTPFRNALRAAGISDEMKQAQVDVALERFLRPAEAECDRLAFLSPLALAVIHDSTVHGSFEKIRDTVKAQNEHAWITEYVESRDKWLASMPRLAATRYRTRFFLDQIRRQNWELVLPLRANGVAITEDVIGEIEKYTGGQNVRQKDSAVGFTPTDRPSDSDLTSKIPARFPQTPPVSQPPNSQSEPPASAGGLTQPTREPESIDAASADTSCLDRLENEVNDAAAKYDQVERVATTVTTRNDAAKSLWTTAIGSVTQTFWALFGLFAGVPREVWLVVALVAAALMLMYLYRQIALGKIRERRE